MKWLVFALALAGVVPAARLLRQRPRWQRFAVAALGFLPFVGLDAVDINVLSHELYRGDSRGLEVTLVDLLAAALALALPAARRPAPYRRTRLAYLALVVLSVSAASMPLFAWFSVWKLVRMYLVLAVAARACEDPRMTPLLLRGMGAGVVWQAVLVVVQHFSGQFRATGAMGHPNTLAMACNLVALVALAVLLARGGGRLAWLVVAGAGVCAVYSLSRAGLAMLVLGSALVVAGSLLRGGSARKLRMVTAAGLLAASGLLFYAPMLVERFLHAPRESAQARVLFERAASAMLADHPWGVGINQFSLVLQSEYAARAGIAGYDAGGIVHNIYRLTAAELGWAGLLAYVAMLAAPLLLAVRGAWRGRRDVRGDVLLGCAAALVVTYLQGTLEWLGRQTAFSYLFWMLAAVVAALFHDVSAARAARPQPAGPLPKGTGLAAADGHRAHSVEGPQLRAG